MCGGVCVCAVRSLSLKLWQSGVVCASSVGSAAAESRSRAEQKPEPLRSQVRIKQLHQSSKYHHTFVRVYVFVYAMDLNELSKYVKDAVSRCCFSLSLSLSHSLSLSL